MQYSLLLLDDEVNLCRSLGRALQRDDTTVDTFTDPAQAIEALSRNAYALALVDLMMPGMNGLDVLREDPAPQPADRGGDHDRVRHHSDRRRSHAAGRLRLLAEAVYQ